MHLGRRRRRHFPPGKDEEEEEAPPPPPQHLSAKPNTLSARMQALTVTFTEKRGGRGVIGGRD